VGANQKKPCVLRAKREQELFPVAGNRHGQSRSVAVAGRARTARQACSRRDRRDRTPPRPAARRREPFDAPPSLQHTTTRSTGRNTPGSSARRPRRRSEPVIACARLRTPRSSAAASAAPPRARRRPRRRRRLRSRALHPVHHPAMVRCGPSPRRSWRETQVFDQAHFSREREGAGRQSEETSCSPREVRARTLAGRRGSSR
jgi:hypothetical protein